jgi:NADH dehydrogenase FAD-containing subunit
LYSVGGGPTGVELAGALAEKLFCKRLSDLDIATMQI